MTVVLICLAVLALLAYGRFNRRSRAIRRLRNDQHYNTPEFLYNRGYDQIGKGRRR